ncbi:MAG: hypothetical protein ACI9XU_000613, partial [Arenicella sp.]
LTRIRVRNNSKGASFCDFGGQTHGILSDEFVLLRVISRSVVAEINRKVAQELYSDNVRNKKRTVLNL